MECLEPQSLFHDLQVLAVTSLFSLFVAYYMVWDIRKWGGYKKGKEDGYKEGHKQGYFDAWEDKELK
jgi:hypothetical protein